jgi:hypothetical protein
MKSDLIANITADDHVFYTKGECESTTTSTTATSTSTITQPDPSTLNRTTLTNRSLAIGAKRFRWDQPFECPTFGDLNWSPQLAQALPCPDYQKDSEHPWAGAGSPSPMIFVVLILLLLLLLLLLPSCLSLNLRCRLKRGVWVREDHPSLNLRCRLKRGVWVREDHPSLNADHD